MDNKIKGSMDMLSAMQVTADMAGLDAECKALLHSKEALAVILQETVEEYRSYSRKEIMEFIVSDSVTEAKEISEGRTNTRIRGDTPEFVQLNEKTTFFDILFRSKNPVLSQNGFVVNLHIDIESQKNYKPGYPIEKRGIYYLARSLSSQLSLVLDGTDYGKLEKCYSIWICRDAIPKEERYSISFYEMVNTKNIGSSVPEKKNFDLMKLVIIRLGDKVYNGKKGSSGYDLLRFLNAIMYPHKKDFMDTISEYIDFSENEELWKETNSMVGLGQSILEEGLRQGMQILVRDNLEERVPRERIIQKLQKHYGLSGKEAESYYEKFSEAE